MSCSVIKGRVFQVLGLWALSLLPLQAEVAAESIRIATLNLQNYLAMDRVVDGRWRRDYPKPEDEKTLIREAIRSVDPDILFLQEIGPEPYLEELRRDLESEGADYGYVIHMEAADETRHLAVLSRLEPSDVFEHTDLNFKYFETREVVKRGMLEVEFLDPAGIPFQVFCVHLKSRWSDEDRDPDSNLRRTREAEACRNRVIERTIERGQRRYLITGDFNDHPNTSTMRRFYKRGDLEIGTLLPAEDSRGHLWTHFFKKESSYSRVDGFVVSHELLPMVEGRSGHVVDWPEGQQGSDHRMVFVDLEFTGD